MSKTQVEQFTQAVDSRGELVTCWTVEKHMVPAQPGLRLDCRIVNPPIYRSGELSGLADIASLF